MKNNNKNNKAVTAKAEAFFNSGNFEKALVQFEKANKMRKDPKTTEGLMKCRQAILNSVGQDGIVFEKDTVINAIRETEIRNKIREQRNKEKANEWHFLQNKKTLQRSKSCSMPTKREPTLKFTNLLQEEDLFLQGLTNLDKLNFRIYDKRGARSQVLRYFHLLMRHESISGINNKGSQ